MILLATDADYTREESEPELPFPTAKPFGFYVPHIRRYCLISASRGALGFFDSLDLAAPFVRIATRAAQRGQGKLDMRLFLYNPEIRAWEACSSTIQL